MPGQPTTPSTLSGHAAEIWRSAFQASYGSTCKDREDRDACAASIAWAAVKRGYQKGESGQWVARAIPDCEDYDMAYCERREFSGAKREKLAESGAAMEGGGYPIENAEDLKNAIHAIGRAKNRAATIAHIRKRAAALGLTALIPEEWGGATKKSLATPDIVERVAKRQKGAEIDRDLIQAMGGMFPAERPSDCDSRLWMSLPPVNRTVSALVARRHLIRRYTEAVDLAQESGWDVSANPSRPDDNIFSKWISGPDGYVLVRAILVRKSDSDEWYLRELSRGHAGSMASALDPGEVRHQGGYEVLRTLPNANAMVAKALSVTFDVGSPPVPALPHDLLNMGGADWQAYIESLARLPAVELTRRATEHQYRARMYRDQRDDHGYTNQLMKLDAVTAALEIQQGKLVSRGGQGSGHFGHAGRPGEVGGSADSGKGDRERGRGKGGAYPSSDVENYTDEDFRRAVAYMAKHNTTAQLRRRQDIAIAQARLAREQKNDRAALAIAIMEEILTQAVGVKNFRDWEVAGLSSNTREWQQEAQQSGAVSRGGPTSGFYGHAGRPGEVGGSLPSGEVAAEARPQGPRHYVVHYRNQGKAEHTPPMTQVEAKESASFLRFQGATGIRVVGPPSAEQTATVAEDAMPTQVAAGIRSAREFGPGSHQVTHATMISSGPEGATYGIYHAWLNVGGTRGPYINLNRRGVERVGTVRLGPNKYPTAADYVAWAQTHATPEWPAFTWRREPG